MDTPVAPTLPAGPAPGLRDELRVAVAALRAAPGRGRLLLLCAATVLVIAAVAVGQIRLNAWNQPFYDAIARKDMAGFVRQLGVFFLIAGGLLVLTVAQTGLNQLIRVKLREVVTRDLVATWMRDRRAARITRAGEIGVNPDQRIHADVQHLSELSTDLGIGLLQASVLLVSFIGVLWVMSAGIVLQVAGRELAIPGYMVWAALLYALTGSWLSWMVGRPLVRIEATRYAREANLRVALVRAVDQADGIALRGGEADERRRLETELERLLEMLHKGVLARVQLTWVTSGYGWAALVVPFAVAAPGYFGGRLSFGELMLVVGAFNQVQQALRWFVDNTGAIADWRATLGRVTAFRIALVDLDRPDVAGESIVRALHPEGRLALDGLSIHTAHGTLELGVPRLELAPGERVLVLGRPFAGKSTLFLAIAGLWTRGVGRIELPPPEALMFLPHHPCPPSGPLRAVLHRDSGSAPDDAALTAALERVGLGRLTGALDRAERWNEELAVGEQERLIYARLLLVRPKWLVCDEGLDPLDDDNRDLVRSILSEELAEAAVLNIANSDQPDRFFSRCVRLVAHPAPAHAAPPRPSAAADRAA